MYIYILVDICSTRKSYERNNIALLLLLSYCMYPQLIVDISWSSMNVYTHRCNLCLIWLFREGTSHVLTVAAVTSPFPPGQDIVADSTGK